MFQLPEVDMKCLFSEDKNVMNIYEQLAEGLIWQENSHL